MGAVAGGGQGKVRTGGRKVRAGGRGRCEGGRRGSRRVEENFAGQTCTVDETTAEAEWKISEPQSPTAVDMWRVFGWAAAGATQDQASELSTIKTPETCPFEFLARSRHAARTLRTPVRVLCPASARECPHNPQPAPSAVQQCQCASVPSWLPHATSSSIRSQSPSRVPDGKPGGRAACLSASPRCKQCKAFHMVHNQTSSRSFPSIPTPVVELPLTRGSDT